MVVRPCTTGALREADAISARSFITGILTDWYTAIWDNVRLRARSLEQPSVAPALPPSVQAPALQVWPEPQTTVQPPQWLVFVLRS